MKPLRHLLIAVILLNSCAISFAQVSKDAAVQIEVAIAKTPSRLLLHWSTDPKVIGYDIYRRNLGSASWGAVKKHLDGQSTDYTDTAVTIGIAYEYRIKKTF